MVSKCSRQSRARLENETPKPGPSDGVISAAEEPPGVFDFAGHQTFGNGLEHQHFKHPVFVRFDCCVDRQALQLVKQSFEIDKPSTSTRSTMKPVLSYVFRNEKEFGSVSMPN
jgi:hypothetical protein